jgi:hypothetical protein
MYIESNAKCIKFFFCFSIVDNRESVVVVGFVVDKDMVLKVKISLNKEIERDRIYVWIRKTNH